MNRYAKMMLMNSVEEDRERREEYRREPMNFGGGIVYNGGHDWEREYRNGGREMYEPENRYRDKTGRERYDDGRFAPKAKIGFALPEEVPTRHETRINSHYGDEMMNRTSDMERGKYDYRSIPAMTREDAEHWMDSMKNTDGTTGPKWTIDQIKQVMAQRGIGGDPLDFAVAMNMVYSDYCNVAKELGVNNMDFYVKMAKAFLDDEDAVKDKLAAYYTSVVKH